MPRSRKDESTSTKISLTPTEQISVREKKETLAAFDKVLKSPSLNSSFRGVRMSRSILMRMALFEGLEVLEKRFNVQKIKEKS